MSVAIYVEYQGKLITNEFKDNKHNFNCLGVYSGNVSYILSDKSLDSLDFSSLIHQRLPNDVDKLTIENIKNHIEFCTSEYDTRKVDIDRMCNYISFNDLNKLNDEILNQLFKNIKSLYQLKVKNDIISKLDELLCKKSDDSIFEEDFEEIFDDRVCHITYVCLAIDNLIHDVKSYIRYTKHLQFVNEDDIRIIFHELW